MLPGEVHRHERFYLDRETGEFEPKFFIVLAQTPGEDVVARLLTSRAHGRPEAPPCYHGDPYPGYYLGVVGEPLTKKTWVDLRKFEDLDSAILERDKKKGLVAHVTTLASTTLFSIMECVANADDTTMQQSNCILDTLAKLRSQ